MYTLYSSGIQVISEDVLSAVVDVVGCRCKCLRLFLVFFMIYIHLKRHTECDTIKAKFEYVTTRIYTHTYYCALYVSIVLGEYFLHNINNCVEHTEAAFSGILPRIYMALNLHIVRFKYNM